MPASRKRISKTRPARFSRLSKKWLYNVLVPYYEQCASKKRGKRVFFYTGCKKKSNQISCFLLQNFWKDLVHNVGEQKLGSGRVRVLIFGVGLNSGINISGMSPWVSGFYSWNLRSGLVRVLLFGVEDTQCRGRLPQVLGSRLHHYHVFFHSFLILWFFNLFHPGK